jgi:hypothetical protein
MRKAIILSTLLVLLLQTGAGLAAVAESNPQIAIAPSPDTGCYRILFDETHGFGTDIFTVQYTISDAYSQLASYLRGQGHIVEALQDPALLNTATLDRYDVLVIALPSEYYTVNEKADIAAFLVQGGRLVTIAENGQFPGDYRDILNDLHAYLGDGLVHNKDIIEDLTDNVGGIVRRPLIHTFSNSPVNSGVGTVLQIYASSLLTGSALDGTAFGDGDTQAVIITKGSLPGSETGELDGGLSDPQLLAPEQVNGPIVVQALAPVGTGDVFAIGDANLWDGSDQDTNGKVNLEEYDNTQLALNVFAYGKQCTKCRWALFKDRDPWPQVPILGLSSSNMSSFSNNQIDSTSANLDWIDPNERIMQNWGIPYTIFRSADIPTVDLTPYCKSIIASDQTIIFYQAISANRTWFESWISSGGILEFHGASDLTNAWSEETMPGGFSMAFFTTEDVSIYNDVLLLFNRPNMITEPELDGWFHSAHGSLIDLPADTQNLVKHEEADQPAAVKFDMGQGCVLATLQTLEWAWDREYSPLLENFLSYDNCQANYQLYLSLSLKSGP